MKKKPEKPVLSKIEASTKKKNIQALMDAMAESKAKKKGKKC